MKGASAKASRWPGTAAPCSSGPRPKTRKSAPCGRSCSSPAGGTNSDPSWSVPAAPRKNSAAGWRVSLDGSFAIVGAPKANAHERGVGAGSVTLYQALKAEWSPLQALEAGPLEKGNGQFGKSVSMTEDAETVLVGAPARVVQSRCRVAVRQTPDRGRTADERRVEREGQRQTIRRQQDLRRREEPQRRDRCLVRPQQVAENRRTRRRGRTGPGKAVGARAARRRTRRSRRHRRNRGVAQRRQDERPVPLRAHRRRRRRKAAVVAAPKTKGATAKATTTTKSRSN